MKMKKRFYNQEGFWAFAAGTGSTHT